MTTAKFRAFALAATGLIALTACVPTTETATKPATLAAPAPVKSNQELYVASSDNGFAVSAVPVEKVPDQFERQTVEFASDEAPGTIIINPAEKHLHFILGNGKAIRYGIAVGRAGFEWSGVANVTSRKLWPTWTPPPEMIERDPSKAKYKDGQPGGPSNPLGARALYLTTNGRDYGYRIHGTPDWWSIGKNASSGCIRMINQDVIDLFNRVPDGAKVIVLTRDGKIPTKLTLPPPAPKKKKVEEVAADTAVATPTDATVPPVAAAAGVATPDAAAAVVAPAADAAATPAAAAIVATPLVTTPAPADAAAAVAPATPVVPAAPVAVTPTPAPAVIPAPAPAAPLPAAPVCKVPLVNGVCPQS